MKTLTRTLAMTAMFMAALAYVHAQTASTTSTTSVPPAVSLVQLNGVQAQIVLSAMAEAKLHPGEMVTLPSSIYQVPLPTTTTVYDPNVYSVPIQPYPVMSYPYGVTPVVYPTGPTYASPYGQYPYATAPYLYPTAQYPYPVVAYPQAPYYPYPVTNGYLP